MKIQVAVAPCSSDDAAHACIIIFINSSSAGGYVYNVAVA